jgi:hypothetical protein
MYTQKDEYPTDQELETIRQWQVLNLEQYHLFMAFIKLSWTYSDCGYWEQEGDKYMLYTGGWSGNESIIDAMQNNHIFWAFYWELSERGGHYVFCPIGIVL